MAKSKKKDKGPSAKEMSRKNGAKLDRILELLKVLQGELEDLSLQVQGEQPPHTDVTTFSGEIPHKWPDKSFVKESGASPVQQRAVSMLRHSLDQTLSNPLNLWVSYQLETSIPTMIEYFNNHGGMPKGIGKLTLFHALTWIANNYREGEPIVAE